MAKRPTEKQIREKQNATQKAIEKKVDAQYKLGKEFHIEPYSPGVVPEKKWQQAKKDGNPEGVPDYE
jgi:hypothetical protein